MGCWASGRRFAFLAFANLGLKRAVEDVFFLWARMLAGMAGTVGALFALRTRWRWLVWGWILTIGDLCWGLTARAFGDRLLRACCVEVVWEIIESKIINLAFLLAGHGEMCLSLLYLLYLSWATSFFRVSDFCILCFWREETHVCFWNQSCATCHPDPSSKMLNSRRAACLDPQVPDTPNPVSQQIRDKKTTFFLFSAAIWLLCVSPASKARIRKEPSACCCHLHYSKAHLCC